MNARRTSSGSPGFGGRFFGPGELRLALLALLAERSAHGYELMTRLESRFDGAYQASAGAVYPTLQQLEDEQLVRMEVADERKVFHITTSGQSEVDGHTTEIDQMWARATSRGQWAPLRDPHAAEIVAPALRLMKAAVKAIVHAHGDPPIVERIRAILEGARQEIEQLNRRRRR